MVAVVARGPKRFDRLHARGGDVAGRAANGVLNATREDDAR